jgi:PilZ domain
LQNGRIAVGVLPLTPNNVERRTDALIELSVPIRVLRFDLEKSETGGFSEDTRTLAVSRSGGSVLLQNSVKPGDSVRVINLENHSEADFRVVGSLGSTDKNADIVAIECLDRRDAFWGVEWTAGSGNSQHAQDLCCRSCGAKANRRLTLMELEVLRSPGTILLSCDSCLKQTYWGDANFDPAGDSTPVGSISPEPSPAIDSQEKTPVDKMVEKRRAKRSSLKLSILVRNQIGEQEVSKIVDVSKLGVSVQLFMTLSVGDIVKIEYPYDPRSAGIEQSAEVRWRSRYYNQDFPRTFGLRFIR